MGLLVFEEAATATAVGIKLNEKNGLEIMPYFRLINRIAVTGSAAAGDAAIDLWLGNTFVGRYYNTSTGTAPVEAKDYKPVGWGLLASEPIVVKIADASGTNILHIEIETAP